MGHCQVLSDQHVKGSLDLVAFEELKNVGAESLLRMKVCHSFFFSFLFFLSNLEEGLRLAGRALCLAELT